MKNLTKSQLLQIIKNDNNILRTVYQIASRKGKETNWDGFTEILDKQLLVHHKLMYPQQYEE